MVSPYMSHTINHYYVVGNHTLCVSQGHFAHAPFFHCCDNPNLGTLRVVATCGGSPMMGVVTFAITNNDLIRLATVNDAATFGVGEQIANEISDQVKSSALYSRDLLMMAAVLRERMELKIDQLKSALDIDWLSLKTLAKKLKNSQIKLLIENDSPHPFLFINKIVDEVLSHQDRAHPAEQVDVLPEEREDFLLAAKECKSVITAIQAAPFYMKNAIIGKNFKFPNKVVFEDASLTLLRLVHEIETTHAEFTQLGVGRIKAQVRKSMIESLCLEIKKMEFDLITIGEILADRGDLLLFVGVPQVDWHRFDSATEEIDLFLLAADEAISLYQATLDKTKSLALLDKLR